MRGPSRWVAIAAVFFFLPAGGAAASRPVVLPADRAFSIDLAGHLEVLKDQSRQLTLTEVVARSDWTGPLTEAVPNYGLTKDAVWLRFSLFNNGGSPRKVFLSFEYPVTDSVKVYPEGPADFFGEMQAGDSVPASANLVPDRHFLFPLTVGIKETVTVYVRVASSASLTIPLRLLSEEALSRKSMRDYTVYGALFGFLSLVLVYFLAVGFRLFEGISLWFFLYSLFFGLHAAIRAGFLRLLLPDQWLGMSNLLNLVVVAGLFFTGAKFFRLFLGLKDQPRPLDAVMAFLQYLSVLFFFVALSPGRLTAAVSILLFVAGPLFSTALSFYLWRRGVANAGYFACGWLAAHLVSAYDYLRIVGLLPYGPFGEWPIPASLMTALLCFSAGLIRRNARDLIMAKTDALTGLANRRRFDDKLREEWNRSLRQKSPLTLIMADVDRFKEYNDLKGHKAGDRSLVSIAAILQGHARRAGDLAARYGGEEFALVLPSLEESQAHGLAEAIRRAVEECFDEGAGGSSLTLSMGVATLVPQEGDSPDLLVLKADQALYAAKKAGRNRTVLNSSLPAEEG